MKPYCSSFKGTLVKCTQCLLLSPFIFGTKIQNITFVSLVTQVYISRDYSSINQLQPKINRLYELFWISLERNITRVKQNA